MAQRDRSAVDVRLGRVGFQRAHAGQALRGKGLVQLDQVDVGQRQLALASTFCTAVTGAMKISLGATPLVALATMRALSGERLSRATSSVTTTTAAAPSLICEALPAVTVPVLAERGPQLGQTFERGVGPGTFVLAHDDFGLCRR